MNRWLLCGIPSVIAILIAYINHVSYRNDLCQLQSVIYDESKDSESHKLSKQFVSSSSLFTLSSYNDQESTANNYALLINTNHMSKYSKIRNSNKIDMNYHNYYTKSRIKLHDEIINLFVNDYCNHFDQNTLNENKWIIFFGGVPGVGKSYLIKHLSHSYFPQLHIDNSIIINADLIRPLLPEYGLYDTKNQKDKQIKLLNKEVGLLCELILWASLEYNTNKNIIFDSTLRHTPWFKWLFKTLSSEYKDKYQLAMIGVIPKDMKTLKDQVMKRNGDLNRKTQWKFVKEIAKDVNKSLYELKRLVHVAINITNPGNTFDDDTDNANQFIFDIFCNYTSNQFQVNSVDIADKDLLHKCDYNSQPK